MQIVFHIGAHCTDEGQIQTCLYRNRVALAKQGIVIPNPWKFRPVLRETLYVLQGKRADAEVQEIMLDSILTEDQPKRIVFSNDGFICGFPRILDRSELYPDIASKCLKLFNLFHDQEVEFCLAIRNPATFLPACFNKANSRDFRTFISKVDPMALRWSEVITRIRKAVPSAPLKVWSNEETPFIWPDLMREIANHDGDTALSGLNKFLGSIMRQEGLERMESYLKTRVPANETQRRRVLSAFLDKFEIEDKSQEVDAPDWTVEYIDKLTDLYEDDLFVIERIPGVRFISP